MLKMKKIEGSERVEVPVESVAIPVEGKPKNGVQAGVPDVGGIFNDSDDEVLHCSS